MFVRKCAQASSRSTLRARQSLRGVAYPESACSFSSGQTCSTQSDSSFQERSRIPFNADSTCAAVAVATLLVGGAGLSYKLRCSSDPPPVEAEQAVALCNWSGTHRTKAFQMFSPETETELEKLVIWADRWRYKIRPLGSALSPNGLALDSRGALSMAQMDGILKIDPMQQTITVRAGTRVSEILEALAKHGLTLDNFSSITEQQIAGWTQTSAHGTGARIPPVDEMITEMKLVTPGKGTLVLKASDTDPTLFRWARVGLGCLGIVSELTLKCRPKYTLHEKTYCTTEAELRKSHAHLLQTYRHVRYMWIPYTDTVVVVVSDIAKPGAQAKLAVPEKDRLKPLQDLLRSLDTKCGDLEGQNFAQLREKLLLLDPLCPLHVARVNRAEAEFWKLSAGERIADSTEILGFECGGSQWVLENCFPCGTISKPTLEDLDYLSELKQRIESERIAAPSPIEQRWTSRSTSPMSPAYSTNSEDIFSWVGVIMYITDESRASAIKLKFREYASEHVALTFKHKGSFHWAKIDLDFHRGRTGLQELRSNMRQRFDVDAFLKLRKELDPNNILGNRLIDEALK